MKSVKFLALCAMIGSLAACGSSSTVSSSGGDTDSSSGGDTDRFDSLGALERWRGGERTEISAEDLPATAEMSGFVSAEFDDGGISEDTYLGISGMVSLTADFANGEITGTAGRFVFYEETRDAGGNVMSVVRRDGELSGTLALEGEIDDTLFSAGLTGELAGRLDDQDMIAEVDMQSEGGFWHLDDNLTGVGGITGTVNLQVGDSEPEDISLHNGILFVEE